MIATQYKTRAYRGYGTRTNVEDWAHVRAFTMAITTTYSRASEMVYWTWATACEGFVIAGSGSVHDGPRRGTRAAGRTRSNDHVYRTTLRLGDPV